MDKKNILYLECGTGISGDMAVAALLDLGADQDKLMKVLSGIQDHGFQVKIGRVSKAGIDCCDFDVILDTEHDGHDHDMEYLYGHLHGEEIHEHHHDDNHRHDNESGKADGENENDHHHHEDEHDGHYHHHHDHEGHHHHHTSLKDVQNIIAGLEMTEGARALALRIFDIVAQAESKAHGVPLGEVHFHEVGAIDSIVDIVSIAVCFDDLQIGEVIIPKITEGSGTVRCQHGILPVPVPAVANIARASALPLQISARQGELVTPTGAAFAAAVMTGDTLPETFRVKKIGMGAGKRAYEIPSILRAMLIESGEESDDADKIWKLECDIDDSTGEQLGYALERLFACGAREAHYSPVFMKKNRPGWELTVLCDGQHLQALENVIFEETTTLGIRRLLMERAVLGRTFAEVKTAYGMITVKISGEGRRKKVHPEYEQVAEAAEKAGVPFAAVYRAAAAAAGKYMPIAAPEDGDMGVLYKCAD